LRASSRPAKFGLSNIVGKEFTVVPTDWPLVPAVGTPI
jgi:hypothetical protein